MKTIKDFLEYLIPRKNNMQKDNDDKSCLSPNKSDPSYNAEASLHGHTADSELLTYFQIKASTELTLGEAEESSAQQLITRQTKLENNMIEDFVDLIYEFDSIVANVESDEIRQIINTYQYRIIEILINNGLSSIDSDAYFDHFLHVPVPFAIVNDGVPIKEFIRIGLRKEDTVFLKAKVIV